MLRQPLYLRAFITAIFSPFLYSFYPHSSLACDVQKNGFDRFKLSRFEMKESYDIRGSHSI